MFISHLQKYSHELLRNDRDILSNNKLKPNPVEKHARSGFCLSSGFTVFTHSLFGRAARQQSALSSPQVSAGHSL